MASKTTLNAANLEALGAAHLAELLLEISTGNANAKRRLRLELAGVESPEKLAGEIRKRLTAIASATAFVGWRSLKGFKADLNTQRRLIHEQVAKTAPPQAMELMWQLIAMSNAVLERATDSSGELLEIFRQACVDMADIAGLATPPPEVLVPHLVSAALDNYYGQNDGLISRLVPQLGETGLQSLRTALKAVATDSEPRATPKSRRTSRWKRGRKLLRETVKRQSRSDMLRQAFEDIADGLGDVDAYMALQPDKRLPDIAAEIAKRLLGAGRADEALGVLDDVRGGLKAVHPEDWQAVRLSVLEALGREADAQAFRLQVFRQSLNPAFLKAYLKRLPDFDDIEAEDVELEYVETIKDVHMALDFLIRWPAPERAARLVLARSAELDGNLDEVLEPAAEKLEARYPLAAIMLLRKMVDVILTGFETHHYERAAGYFDDMARLVARIDDFGRVEPQESYLRHLKAHHGRKIDFWSLTD